MAEAFFNRARRILRKPPSYVARRVLSEVVTSTERWRLPLRNRHLTLARLLRRCGARSTEELWQRLVERRTLRIPSLDSRAMQREFPREYADMLLAASHAMDHRVDLLGSGPVDLGPCIDWHSDFKVGFSWPPRYFRDIDYANLDRPSDVKVPWELSRLQWLMPLGMAYHLTGEDRYAAAAREVIDSWIRENPCGFSVNWTCTMEAAMRILVWAWFLEVMGRSQSWCDEDFRRQFLLALWQHVDFACRHIERSDVNGNHFTADAAALVVGGLLFGDAREGRRWWRMGHAELEREIRLQVFEDGVDFEASVPYHRLVCELFLVAAFCMMGHGKTVSDGYRQRLRAMAGFVSAYSRPDGSSPYWGDADDARALPFRMHPIEDHRYLVGLVGDLLEDSELLDHAEGSEWELAWWHGMRPRARRSTVRREVVKSAAFPQAGVFVMRNERDHVFVDCGPVGLAGRGGHGHNDCLGIEVMLDGTMLVRDSGSFVYTANPAERNRFRGTSMHSTPMVDGVEMNAFLSDDNLWQLRDEARPIDVRWSFAPDADHWQGGHTGYHKLEDPVTVRRALRLDHVTHRLEILDELSGAGAHEVVIPLQLAPGVRFERVNDCAGQLIAGDVRFELAWSSSVSWQFETGLSRVSPSYGVVLEVVRLQWCHAGVLPCSLNVVLSKSSQVRSCS